MFWMAMILLAGYLLRRYIDYKRDSAQSSATAQPVDIDSDDLS